MSSERVGGEVLLEALVGDLPLVDHAAGVVDQHVQLLVLRGERVGELSLKRLVLIFRFFKQKSKNSFLSA